MEVHNMMKVSEEQTEKYIYQLNGRTIKLDKDIVDAYSKYICPMSEEYISILIEQFGKGVKDRILSCKIALGMTKELTGFGYTN